MTQRIKTRAAETNFRVAIRVKLENITKECNRNENILDAYYCGSRKIIASLGFNWLKGCWICRLLFAIFKRSSDLKSSRILARWKYFLALINDSDMFKLVLFLYDN